MAQIRGKDTKPELRVRRLLHRLGYRFRLHQRQLPGAPDIVLPKHRAAVFVHGCFWHRHPGCRFAYSPKSRLEFWQQKFAENTARDARNQVALREAGWNVVIVWECETDDEEALSAKLPALIHRHVKYEITEHEALQVAAEEPSMCLVSAPKPQRSAE